MCLGCIYLNISRLIILVYFGVSKQVRNKGDDKHKRIWL